MTTATTITIVILFFMALIVAAWIIVEIGKRNTVNYNEYENDYGQIKCLINNYAVNDINDRTIQRRLTALGKMKHKNDEKTDVLDTEFKRKFKCKI